MGLPYTKPRVLNYWAQKLVHGYGLCWRIWKKSQYPYLLPPRGVSAAHQTRTNFVRVGDLPNVITHAKFEINCHKIVPLAYGLSFMFQHYYGPAVLPVITKQSSNFKMNRCSMECRLLRRGAANTPRGSVLYNFMFCTRTVHDISRSSIQYTTTTPAWRRGRITDYLVHSFSLLLGPHTGNFTQWPFKCHNLEPSMISDLYFSLP